jgi:hypothetical protein
MFSGTAIPLLAAGAVLGWRRHGFLRTALPLLPAAVVYLSWYLLVARPANQTSQGFTGIADLGRAVLYAGAMVAGGLGRALPLVWPGVVPAIAVLVWVVVALRRRPRDGSVIALALAAGCLVFVVLTTYSRVANGLSSAAAQRYAYLTITLLLPAMALILTWLASRSRRAFWISTCSVLVLVGYNAVVLAAEAAFQANREAGSQERIEHSLDALLDDPHDKALLDAPADPQWAPDLRGRDLLLLHEAGELP